MGTSRSKTLGYSCYPGDNHSEPCFTQVGWTGIGRPGGSPERHTRGGGKAKMKRRTWVIGTVGFLGLALLSAAGCGVLVDPLNPGLISSLGLDPASVQRPPGRVIMAFENDTTSPAIFVAYHAGDSSDLTKDPQNFSVQVEAAETRNAVIDCPIGIMGPGAILEDFTIGNTAAGVDTANGQVAVLYLGTPLISGSDFNCGDVIVVRLQSAATGDQQEQFVLTVEVQPGK